MRLIGQSIKRREDSRFLVGRSCFLDDVHLPRMLYASFLRSPYAHAKITRIDTEAALKSDGVVAILVGSEIVEKSNPLPHLFHPEDAKFPRQYCLAVDKVRFTGEPVAVLAAEDRYQAEDALESIRVDYEPLPVLLDPEEAISSPVLIHDDIPRNLYLKRQIVGADVQKALASADRTIEERIRIQRQSPAPMEPHGVVADFDPFARTLTIWASTQIPHDMRIAISIATNVPQHKIRVIAKDVGGGFGSCKYHPEDVATCLLSMKTGRPVKWIATRQELFLAGYHAREQVHDVKVAFDRHGRILALCDKILASMGAYLPRETVGPPSVTSVALPGPYDIENVSIELLCVAVNKSTSGAYRGFGRPQATFVMERIIDRIARELGLDPAEVRLRNLIPKQKFPYRSATGVRYDTGDYPALLKKALELSNYESIRRDLERENENNKQQIRRGVGIAFYIEMTGFGPAKASNPMGAVHGGHESVIVRMDPEGGATILTGLMPHGQSHETTMSQVLADLLGLRMDDISFVYGDTESTPYGHGTFASRSAVVGSGSIYVAAKNIIEKGKKIASHLLEARLEDVEFEDGLFFVKGSKSHHHVHIKDIARVANFGLGLPPEIPLGLEANIFYDPGGWTMAFGAHIATVEVDLETGKVTVPKYFIVHDSGVVINPAVAEGQIHGGLLQGIGGALLEEIEYTPDGQPSSSFLDYLLPTSEHIPDIKMDHTVTPSETNPLGVKGLGEGGTIPAAAALANALEDALGIEGREVGKEIRVLNLPLSPEKVWRLVSQQQKSR